MAGNRRSAVYAKAAAAIRPTPVRTQQSPCAARIPAEAADNAEAADIDIGLTSEHRRRRRHLPRPLQEDRELAERMPEVILGISDLDDSEPLPDCGVAAASGAGTGTPSAFSLSTIDLPMELLDR
ncbi:MAG: hypothetical protein JSR91_04605 [Proteobacteria bacterium]|nr:hypothetical protein [Pseudomonadota bacterium]